MSSKKNITQQDVAKKAGVTRSMVSYVLTGSTERSVAAETRQKILSAINELGYRPNKAAQALQQGEAVIAEKQIGVVLCDSSVFLRPYYTEIISGIHTAAYDNNYHVRFIRFFDELKNPILFNELIHQEEIGGLILVATDQCIKNKEDKEIIEEIKERIEKIVCVEWKTEGLSSVHFDRQEAAKKATEYLFQKGYKDIAYIGEEDDRVIGFKQAFVENKKSISNLYLDIAYNMPGGYFAIEKLFKIKNKLPRAFVCGSDEVAIGIMCFLNEKKISIPEEVAIISIDNIEMSGYTNPPLTTINVQKTAMGTRAVEMIVNKIAEQGENAISITLPTTIVERKSC